MIHRFKIYFPEFKHFIVTISVYGESIMSSLALKTIDGYLKIRLFYWMSRVFNARLGFQEFLDIIISRGDSVCLSQLSDDS